MFLARQLTTIFIALAFVGVIVAAHVFSPDQAPRLVEHISNSLHAPGFAAVAVIILRFIKPSHAEPADYLKAGLIAAAIGVLAEAAQIPGPRDADVVDIIDDFIGITAGLGSIALLDRKLMRSTHRSKSSFLHVITAVAIVLTVGPMTWYSHAYVRQQLAVPALLTFDHRWETSIIERRFFRRSNLGAPPSGWPVSSGKIAYARVGKYGSAIISIFPYADWSDYSTLSFVGSIESDQKVNVRLYIRDNPLSGREHRNEYVEKLEFGPESKRYMISLANIPQSPDGNAFDVANIWSFGLTADQKDTGLTYLLDDFRLE